MFPFLSKFPHCLDSGIVSPLRLRWVKGVCVFRCFGRMSGNRGLERTPNKSQHTKLTPEKKILPPLLPRFELATFRSRVQRFENEFTCNLSTNIQSQSSQLAEPLWTDPGIKCGISMRELISTKKKKKKCRQGMNSRTLSLIHI